MRIVIMVPTSSHERLGPEHGVVLSHTALILGCRFPHRFLYSYRTGYHLFLSISALHDTHDKRKKKTHGQVYMHIVISYTRTY